MKKILLAFAALLAVTLTACNDNDKNSFQDTSWTSTTYMVGYTAKITFSNLTCSLSITSDASSAIQQGANYTYTHSGNTASLTPVGETAVSHEAVISGSTLTLTNLTSDVVITFTKD